MKKKEKYEEPFIVGGLYKHESSAMIVRCTHGGDGSRTFAGEVVLPNLDLGIPTGYKGSGFYKEVFTFTEVFAGAMLPEESVLIHTEEEPDEFNVIRIRTEEEPDEFNVGSLYINPHTGLIVTCTGEGERNDLFCGVVINPGKKSWRSPGEYENDFIKSVFVPYLPKSVSELYVPAKDDTVERVRLETTGVVTIDTIEDGNQAMICDSFTIDTFNSDEDNGMVVTLSSWDEDTIHKDLSLLIDKKVKITIEVIE
jgi:hypothetical protein